MHKTVVLMIVTALVFAGASVAEDYTLEQVLGQAIKGADDIAIAELNYEDGLQSVKFYQSEAMPNVTRLLPALQLAEDAYDLAKGCDALVVCTEWNEFKHLDMDRIRQLMRQPIIVDGRNLYTPDKMKRSGFIYRGMGRGY